MLETHYSLIDEIDCDYLHPDVFTLEINVLESEHLLYLCMFDLWNVNTSVIYAEDKLFFFFLIKYISR